MSIIVLDLYLVQWAGQFLQFTSDVHLPVGTTVQLLNQDFHFQRKAFYRGDGTFLLEGQRRSRRRGEDMETINWSKNKQSIRFWVYLYIPGPVHVDMTWNVLLSLIQQQRFTVNMLQSMAASHWLGFLHVSQQTTDTEHRVPLQLYSGRYTCYCWTWPGRKSVSFDPNVRTASCAWAGAG